MITGWGRSPKEGRENARGPASVEQSDGGARCGSTVEVEFGNAAARRVPTGVAQATTGGQEGWLRFGGVGELLRLLRGIHEGHRGVTAGTAHGRPPLLPLLLRVRLVLLEIGDHASHGWAVDCNRQIKGSELMDLDDGESEDIGETDNYADNWEEAVDDNVEEAGGRGNEEDDEEGRGMDEGDGDIQEEYCFQFDDAMDPVGVVEAEADAVELEPYRLFERLEYEALAEKKRKSLLQEEGSGCNKKTRREDAFGANFDDILDAMNHSFRRKSRHQKKRGKRKGSRKKLTPEVTKMLGDATLYYASGCYDKAIQLLKDVLQIAPNLSDVYHTLGLIYNSMGDRKKALTYYMFAAHMAPKDPSLWKLLVAWSIEQGNTGQARHCLRKAIRADPLDIGLKFDYALLYIEVGEYQEAWKSLEEIVKNCQDDFEAQIKVCKIYHEHGQISRATEVLEACIDTHSSLADVNTFSLLIILLMKTNSHGKALKYIDQARSIFYSGKEVSLFLALKAGICELYLGDTKNAETHFQRLRNEPMENVSSFILEVANAYSNVGLHDSALNYYSMLQEISSIEKGPLLLKIGHCYLSLKERVKAIPFFHQALSLMENDIDARLVLSSLLNEDGRMDEAILLLLPPGNCESSDMLEPGHWSLNGRIKLQLAKFYHEKRMLQEFADTIFDCVRETLFIEAMNEKVKSKKRLSMSALLERAKLLEEHEDDSVFRGFRPIAKATDLNKASRARKLLREKEKHKEAGDLELEVRESDDESEINVYREPPLQNILKDEFYPVILDLCNALVSLHRYWDALEIIKMLLYSTISKERKEELRTIGAKIALGTTDPKHGYDCVRDFVQKHPYSSTAWNCYYKVASRLEYPYAKHLKFLHEMRETRKDCVPPILIAGHQFAIVRYQSAAREYLQAYKLQPDDALINLCVGTSLINVSLGFRLKNKHLCVLQGIAFLLKYLSICQNSQEALYNVARAYHIVGHFTLAVVYYEKVLAMEERDKPIPRLPNENPTLFPPREALSPGYCNLRREAAFNLHLIYKKSGATDLARHVLKMYCSI
ncbi:tetratricopeptide repeat (TPR)-containing protein [Wolffia australiana]